MKKETILAGMLLLTTVACSGRLPNQTENGSSTFLAQASGTTAASSSSAATSTSTPSTLGSNVSIQKQIKNTETIEKKMDESLKELGSNPGTGKDGEATDTVRPYVGKNEDIKLQKEFENSQKIDSKLAEEQAALQDPSQTKPADNTEVVRPFLGTEENIKLQKELANNQSIEEKSQEKVEELSK